MDKESIMGECLIIRSGGGADTSDATVSGSYILTGYSCYVNDVKVIGTMPNRASVTLTLDPGEQYTIPYGYHNGNGEISVSSLADNTPATADSRWILWAKTGWVNGELVAGAMVNRGSVTQTLSVNGSYTIPVGWHSGSGRVSQNLATQGSVNMTPTTTNQTACPANRWTTGSIIIVGSSSLVASNIRNGVTIFGVRGTFRGWVDNTYDWVNRSYSEVWNYGEGITRTFYDQTISGSTLTNLKNSFSQASFYVEVWARVQNGTWGTYAHLYVDNDGRAFAMASVRASVGGADTDWASSTINLFGVSSSIQIWVYAYGSGLAPMGWSWVTSLRLRFSK